MKIKTKLLLILALISMSTPIFAHDVYANGFYEYVQSGVSTVVHSSHKIILRNGRDYAVTFRWWMDLCSDQARSGCSTDNADVTLQPHTEQVIERQLGLGATFYGHGTQYQTIARSGVQGDGATEVKAFGTVVVQ